MLNFLALLCAILISYSAVADCPGEALLLGKADSSTLARVFTDLVNQFIQEKKNEFSTTIFSRISQKYYEIGPETYEMVAVLGTGREGTVFLLESKNSQRLILKSFVSESAVGPNVAKLMNLKKAGNPTINLLARFYRGLIGEYVPGMFLHQIRQSRLDASHKRFFENAFLRLKQKYPAIDDINWLLYFDGNEISAKVIDAD